MLRFGGGTFWTRMHSSRMRTGCCSGRRGGGGGGEWCIPACTGQEGCIPTCTGQGVCVCTTACIGRGVCVFQGVSAQGVCPWEVSAQGDVCPGGCLPRGCLLRGCLPDIPVPPEQNDWQTPVKISPGRNFVADGKNGWCTCDDKKVRYMQVG